MDAQETRVRFGLSKAAVWVLAAAVLVTALWLSADYRGLIETQETRNRLRGAAATQRVVADLEQQLGIIPPLGQSLARELGTGEWDDDRLRKRLRHVMQNHLGLLGIGVAYEPFAFAPNLRLYAPYLLRQDDRLRWTEVDALYDYTQPGYHWYHAALEEGARWNGPYLGQTSGQHVVEYSAPIVHEGRPVGQVFITYPLASLLRRIDAMDLGAEGYSFVATTSGKLVAYPVRDYVLEGRSVDDLVAEGRPELRQVWAMVRSRHGGLLEHAGNVIGRPTWVHFQHMPSTGWIVMTAFPKRPPLHVDQPGFIELIWALLAWMGALCLMLWAVRLQWPACLLANSWLAAALVSSIFIAGVGLLWALVLHAGSGGVVGRGALVNKARLDEFERTYIHESLGSSRDLPVFIPTGLFVKSVEFSSANNVILTGYVWQRYRKELDEHLNQGIVMPEAATLALQEAYRRREGDATVIGWAFTATLRQTFDYSHYPFDRQEVWIRLWHKDFDRNVVLTPDLDAYDRLNPKFLPGIERDFVLTGWDLTQSYFDYRYNSYNTDFGITGYQNRTGFPELYFNIGMKRRFITPFISRLSPLLVVLLMLYAILITVSADKQRESLIGFNAIDVVTSCSALFFVVLLSHIDMRSSLEAKEVFYLEKFFFVAYVMLILVASDSILFSLGRPWRLIQYRDNYLPKLFYWPLLGAICFFLTLHTFYP